MRFVPQRYEFSGIIAGKMKIFVQKHEIPLIIIRYIKEKNVYLHDFGV